MSGQKKLQFYAFFALAASGHSRQFRDVRSMSDLPHKADIRQHDWHVRKVPVPKVAAMCKN
jgi:hypothetical protein